MRVHRKFTPVTIDIETEGDLDFLKQILNNSFEMEGHRKGLFWPGTSGPRMTDLQERILHFRKQLGI